MSGMRARLLAIVFAAVFAACGSGKPAGWSDGLRAAVVQALIGPNHSLSEFQAHCIAGYVEKELPRLPPEYVTRNLHDTASTIGSP